MEIQKLYEIDKNKKYMLQVPAHTTPKELEIMAKSLTDWLESDDTFILIPEDIELVKVSDTDHTILSPRSS